MELVSALTLATLALVPPPGVELELLTQDFDNPPGVAGVFFVIGNVVPCSDAVLYNGQVQDGPAGIYSASSEGLLAIVNPQTPVPDSGELFGETGIGDCLGDRILFNGAEGHHMWNDGVITTIIDKETLIDGREVRSFGSISGNRYGIAMTPRLGLPTVRALAFKPFDGAPVLIADETTVMPGQTESVTIFDCPLMVGPDVVFFARTELISRGFFRWKKGQGISIIVDSQTAISTLPGAVFGLFDRGIANLSYGFVFGASFFNPGSATVEHGIFVWNNGRVEPLAVPGDQTEDGETLILARDPSGAGSLLSFTARTPGRPLGLYVRTFDGKIMRVFELNDPFDGRPLGDFKVKTNHKDIAIEASFFDGDPPFRAIYRASFITPEPVTNIPTASGFGFFALILLLSVAGLCLLRMSRRKASR